MRPVTGFSDVPASHPFARDIAWMVERGVTQGYPDGTFRPAALVTRGQMAAFLRRFDGAAPAPVPLPTFVDVPASHVFAADVEWLAAQGVTVGTTTAAGRVFRPEQPVSRGQMAAFLHRYAGAPAVALPAAASFADVPAGSQFSREVEWMAAQGVTRGTVGPDGVRRFDPAGNVTRGQMAAFLHRFAEPTAQDGEYAGDVHHLLRRLTYGSTPELLAEVQALGPTAWLDQQLAPEGIDDSECASALAPFTLVTKSPAELDTAQKRFTWDAMFQLRATTLVRATLSRRQVFEVMVEFWSNHLNITCPSSDVWATKPWDDVHVVRKHALGRYEDMLAASMTSPAMLQYLDGARSKGTAPNENYGRELLELHTVGRDSYTQSDVLGAARALTGLTVWDPWSGGTAENLWTFRYRPDWRYVGPVQVLGWSHPNGDKAAGVEVARDLARYLAHHPATARRIAHKLAVRFVADEPPASLVDRLAAVYLESGTAVAPVLRALVLSPEFAASTGQKTRRPYEDAVATLRALGARAAAGSTGRTWHDLQWQLARCGQPPLSWAPPDGYPDVAAAWTGAGSVLSRWNLHVGLAGRWWKDGISWPPLADHLLGGRPATREELVRRLTDRLLPGLAVPPAHHSALVAFLGGPGPVKDGDLGGLLPVLVALVLDSPLWSTR